MLCVFRGESIYDHWVILYLGAQLCGLCGVVYVCGSLCDMSNMCAVVSVGSTNVVCVMSVCGGV